MFKKCLIFSVSLMLVALGVQAKPSVTDRLKTELQPKFPFEIDSVTRSPIKGLYEVSSGPILFYASEDARYVVQGNIFDLKNNEKNISESKRAEIRKTILNKLPAKQYITFAPKNPKHTLTVFTDVTCTYCRKLHADIKQLNDNGVAVRYLSFPRGGVGSEGYKLAVSVWCAKDRQKAMTEAKQGKAITPAQCENSVKDEFELGVKMGVMATPTLVFEDGTISGGYLPPERLLKTIKFHAH